MPSLINTIITYICSMIKAKGNFFFGLILSFIMAACATVVPPDGGPKDTTPPVPMSFHPKSKVTNFKGEKIAIKFDEYIELKDLNSQLVVSPAMPQDPDIYIQGKKLIIKTPDSLEENTTYTIFLGNSVVNYKEGLPVSHFQYVLSTGNTLDSLRIQGNLKNAFDLKKEEGILVMLYKLTADSTPYLQRPFYIAKTYASGDFVLDNLSAGKYLIFALKDMNSNYLYDQPSEEIAFLDSLIIPAPVKPADDSLDLIHPVNINMYLFKEVEKVQGINRHAVIRPNLFELDFKRPTQDLKIEPLNFTYEGEWYYPVLSSEKDTLKAWIIQKVPDTLKVKISDANQVVDTIQLVLKKPARKKKSQGRKKSKDVEAPKDTVPEIVRIGVKSNTGAGLAFFSNPKLTFSTPIKELNTRKIKLYQRKDTNDIPINFNLYFKDTLAADILVFDVDLQEGSSYKLFMPDSVFFDIFGNTNDSLEIRFSTTKQRSYGSLKLNVSYTDSQPLLIQLLNDKDEIINQSVLKDSIIEYPYLTPGIYKIKAIKDRNNNGKWDTGNYLKKQYAERVYFLNSAVKIRANWDIEQKWVMD